MYLLIFFINKLRHQHVLFLQSATYISIYFPQKICTASLVLLLQIRKLTLLHVLQAGNIP